MALLTAPACSAICQTMFREATRTNKGMLFTLFSIINNKGAFLVLAKLLTGALSCPI
jgi:hypothetical protein